MGMYRNRMPDREISAEMTKADYWEVQADMWHQNYKEAADEIERLREALKTFANNVKETNEGIDENWSKTIYPLKAENQRLREEIALLNSMIQTEHTIIRAALKGGE